ncbi:NADH-quinone oxidoreductase subunit C [Streptomyces xiaopingdaonensis]|uniref:NADH-quinone oxidoreductase subunit C n=1 Tax=Streptomyces xiaopingdaonensis TaxID=1565415 RepID=UPI0002E2C5D6|nr:NADH-quinone oxidoreductase subunit C [Streptomyces xiaopingdaonensis]
MSAEEPAGWLPWSAGALFGPGAEATEAYGLLTVDVPADTWLDALTRARDRLGCTFFDWLSAVDEPALGFHVCAHVAALPQEQGAGVRTLLLRTTVPHEAPSLPSATGVWAGAAWHERETHEMFGIDFPGHPDLTTLLLPDGFEGHPLRKDFVLASRVVKQWPGAKEPGESGHGGPKRRQMLPPGVPDPNEWGPQKGQLPPLPGRPTRGGRSGERPTRPRRNRSAGAGSASQRPEESTGAEAAPDATPARPPRGGPRRNRSAGAGSASQRAADAANAPQASTGSRPDATDSGTPGTGATAPRSPDAPWHTADQQQPRGTPEPAEPATPDAATGAGPDGGAGAEPDGGGSAAAGAQTRSGEPESEPLPGAEQPSGESESASAPGVERSPGARASAAESGVEVPSSAPESAAEPDAEQPPNEPASDPEPGAEQPPNAPPPDDTPHRAEGDDR